jgi:hypothetical protein
LIPLQAAKFLFLPLLRRAFPPKKYSSFKDLVAEFRGPASSGIAGEAAEELQRNQQGNCSGKKTRRQRGSLRPRLDHHLRV